jgi:hypothetical protein
VPAPLYRRAILLRRSSVSICSRRRKGTSRNGCHTLTLGKSEGQRESELTFVREPEKADEFDAPGDQCLDCGDSPSTA